MYSKLLNQYPLTTKCITSGFMFSLGDFITQKVIQNNQQFNYRRNLNLALTGALYLGPCLHFWYSRFLPAIVNRIVGSDSSKFKSAFTGMLFDQLLFAPPFLTGFYIIGNFMNNPSVKGAQNGWQQAKLKMKDTMITNWKIWPAATLFNLMFIPIQYRVLFANFIGLFWNMYLSYMMNYKEVPKP